MKIEIAEPGRMTQSGSSLLKLIQNNNMPILDLLVRESIQNSLDAKNDTDPYVTVDFFTGEFNKISLNKELEGITETLNRKYWKDTYKFIAVRDSNTVGLTGKLHYDEVTDNQYGNLLKLIYEISKPQEAEGAGGSWGLGKTVYFRVGIGLVVYYSRILNEEGIYESRLAASLVENEMNADSLIPALPGKSKRGIAWWGQEIGSNKTKPITDEKYIEKILNIFEIEPYEGDLTGTTIIIPYIDEQMLLENNQIEYKDSEDNRIRPFWRCSIEDYLRISIQRWYAPRLNNEKYPYGKFLRARINKKGIGLDNMEPAFQIVQALYNRAVSEEAGNDILAQDGVECKSEDILLRKVLETTKAGTIAYTKVPRKILKTGYPDNKPEPYSLEEYVRKSEMADHTSWGDFSMGNNNPRIVSKVQAQVNSKISKEFFVEEEDTTSRLNSGLGKMFGDLLLPPENFGKKPSGGTSGGQGGSGHTETHKNVVFGYESSKTKYFANGMMVKLTIKSRRKILATGINLAIDSEIGAIKPKDWEEKMGLSMPFEIVSADIVVTKVDKLKTNLKMAVDSSNESSGISDISCELLKTKNGAGYGIHVRSDAEHLIEMELDITLQLNRKDIKPLFNVEKNEGDK